MVGAVIVAAEEGTRSIDQIVQRLLNLDETLLRTVDALRSYLTRKGAGTASPEARGRLAMEALTTQPMLVFDGDRQLEESYRHYSGNGFFDSHIRRFVEYADRNGWHIAHFRSPRA